MAKRKPKESATTTFPFGPVLRTNRMFVQLKAMGHCDDKGKTILGIGFGGKMIGEPDKPLSTLAVPLLHQIIETARYSSDEALQADLEQLKTYVNDLH